MGGEGSGRSDGSVGRNAMGVLILDVNDDGSVSPESPEADV